ncbi:MAG: YidC/Oxa1 family membrane protein insertase [Anaerolineae bacterium]|nr:YidC/Oxa1 family membrane protein insertase [Anaerolineae bacterium]
MVLLYGLIGENFGLAIILFTLAIRLLTFPLTSKQLKSTQAMQELQQSKKWQQIQKKYKDNKEKLAQEQMKIYQEMGVSPFSSCLPTMLQFVIIIPVFYAVRRVLATTPLELLQLSRDLGIPDAANLIPLNSQFLWMDLGQPERLYLDFLPGIGIPVLAIIVVITTYLQSKLMTPATPTGDQGPNPTAGLTLMMPVMMGWISYIYSAGLALYFLTGNLVSIIQYAATGRLSLSNLRPGNGKS